MRSVRLRNVYRCILFISEDMAFDDRAFLIIQSHRRRDDEYEEIENKALSITSPRWYPFTFVN